MDTVQWALMYGLEYYPMLVAKVVWRRVRWKHPVTFSSFFIGPEYLAEIDIGRLNKFVIDTKRFVDL